MSTTNYFDLKVFKSFILGNTDGITNFDSQIQKTYLKEFQPSSISDLAILYVLDRPDADKAIPHLIKRKKGIEPVLYHHPMLIPFFECSYGIPVFQEQWTDFAREVAGLSVESTDNLRVAMGKKHATILNTLKVDFINGLKNNSTFTEGADNIEETIEKIWSDWYNTAPYLFKKHFAFHNAIIAYQEMVKLNKQI